MFAYYARTMQGLIERYMKMKPARVPQAETAMETQTVVRYIYKSLSARLLLS